MTVYEIHFEFAMRDGWPPAATMIAFRRTADAVIGLLDAVDPKREYVSHIQLTEIEEVK